MPVPLSIGLIIVSIGLILPVKYLLPVLIALSSLRSVVEPTIQWSSSYIRFGFGSINFIELFVLFVLIKLYLINGFKVMPSRARNIFVILFICFFTHIIVQLFNDEITAKVIISSIRTYFLFVIISEVIIYIRLYGHKYLFFAIFVNFTIYLATAIMKVMEYGNPLFLHNPYIGFGGGFIILYVYQWYEKRKTLSTTIVFFLTMTLCTIIPILGAGRGAMICIIATYIAFYFYYRKQAMNKRIALFFMMSFIMLVGVVSFIILSPKYFFTHLGSSNITNLLQQTLEGDENTEFRFVRWQDGLETFTKSPILGTEETGYDTGIWVYHNVFLTYLVKGGLLIMLPLGYLYLSYLFRFVRLLFKWRYFLFFFGGSLIFQLIIMYMTNTPGAAWFRSMPHVFLGISIYFIEFSHLPLSQHESGLLTHSKTQNTPVMASNELPNAG
ncbi:MAG: O-antigen ligase family protein [Candidatus Cloacimonetes bacterium]|nr:O-antigen ligase family protein [Candidatus Cloacimonadota bacterium]